MKITLPGIIFIVAIVLFSIFIANFSNLISVSFDFEREKELYKSRNLKEARPDGFTIGNSNKHLIWFVQVSDIHISAYHDVGRINDLKDFCDQTVKIINPKVVLASGDLTDAKLQDNVGSKQSEIEWKSYKSVLENCEVLNKIPWLDVRGNHDNFDVPGVTSNRNYFRRFSAQGHVRPRSYLHKLKSDTETYSFVGLDACPDQGVRRPFNFIGVLPSGEIEAVTKLASEATSANYTLWFGHYPTSCILSSSVSIRDIIGSGENSLVYMCGHFHSMGGLVPRMYTIHKQGFMELELADWKDNRMFRVAAIDHGLFSFVDIKHRDWPIILVTNPKHALFQTPVKENLDLIKTSTHVRVLVFSPSAVLSVRVQIDDDPWEICTHTKGGPLFTMKWDPNKYAEGLHTIKVAVLDEAGRQKMIEQPFSIDGTSLSFEILPRILLMLNASATFQLLFGIGVLGIVLPLCVCRYMNLEILLQRRPLPVIKSSFIRSWVVRLWILSNTDRFFYPLVLYPLYMALGPWSVGELMEDHIGVMFAWGIIVNSVYLPGSFTYFYALAQLILFNGPFMLLLSYMLDKRLRRTGVHSQRRKAAMFVFILFENLPFLLLLVLQLILTHTFWLAYGTMALLVGPFRLIPLVMIGWLRWEVQRIPYYKLKKSVYVWSKAKEETSSSELIEDPSAGSYEDGS